MKTEALLCRDVPEGLWKCFKPLEGALHGSDHDGDVMHSHANTAWVGGVRGRLVEEEVGDDSAQRVHQRMSGGFTRARITEYYRHHLQQCFRFQNKIK